MWRKYFSFLFPNQHERIRTEETNIDFVGTTTSIIKGIASNPDISRNHMDRMLRVMTTEYDAILDKVNEAKKKNEKKEKEGVQNSWSTVTQIHQERGRRG